MALYLKHPKESIWIIWTKRYYHTEWKGDRCGDRISDGLTSISAILKLASHEHWSLNWPLQLEVTAIHETQQYRIYVCNKNVFSDWFSNIQGIKSCISNLSPFASLHLQPETCLTSLSVETQWFHTWETKWDRFYLSW